MIGQQESHKCLKMLHLEYEYRKFLKSKSVLKFSYFTIATVSEITSIFRMKNWQDAEAPRT